MDKQALDPFIIQFDQVSLFRQRNKRFRKPNFIGVGAGRCGTSSIYRYLNDHPDVYMSPVKEINYFGIRNSERNPYGLSFREYLYYFLGAEEQSCVGEISPAYLTIPQSASLIKKNLGNVKILITLRDPIDRAISQYKHHFYKHKIENINEYFKVGLQEISAAREGKYLNQWYHPAKNLMQSSYFDSVNNYISKFDDKNIFILIYDQLQDDSTSILEKLCHFLEIDYLPTEVRRENSSDSIKQNINLDPQILDQLLELFSPDIEKLESIINIDLSNWYQNYTKIQLS